jgi:hypothetical protein
MDAFVRVASCHSEGHANHAVGLLELEGIPAMLRSSTDQLFDTEIGGGNWMTREPYGVFVHRKDFTEARELLAGYGLELAPPSEDGDMSGWNRD